MELHIPDPAAHAVFNIGPLPVTNAMINGWIAVLFFVGIAFLIRNRNDVIPGGLQNVVEAVVEFMLKEIEKVTNDYRQAKQFLPIVGTIFVFILVSNWMSILPGTGTIFASVLQPVTDLIPFISNLQAESHILRPAASDLNLTLAIAAFAVLSSHVIGLTTLGVVTHISKFVNIRGIFVAFKEGPIEVGVAVIEFFVGLIEIVSEVAKVVSLALRLFGNIFAGEVLLTVMLGLAGYVVPVPFYFMELLVGAVQATVFAMLTLAYLVVATSEHGHNEEHEEGEEIPEVDLDTGGEKELDNNPVSAGAAV